MAKTLRDTIQYDIDSKDLNAYKERYQERRPFEYAQNMKSAWRKVLDENITLYDAELK